MPDEKKIFPIILAAGSGTRLWPLSRDSRPKQFIKFFEETTLFQKTVNGDCARSVKAGLGWKRLNNPRGLRSIAWVVERRAYQ